MTSHQHNNRVLAAIGRIILMALALSATTVKGACLSTALAVWARRQQRDQWLRNASLAQADATRAGQRVHARPAVQESTHCTQRRVRRLHSNAFISHSKLIAMLPQCSSM